MFCEVQNKLTEIQQRLKATQAEPQNKAKPPKVAPLPTLTLGGHGPLIVSSFEDLHR